MKLSRYFYFVCILAMACVFTVGCEKMEKPVMDAMDMAMTDTETETPADMDGTTEASAEIEIETPADMDMPADMDDGEETPADMDTDGETPADMDVDATITISPTEITLPEVGEQFTINVNIDSKKPVAGYQFYLNFDVTVLKYVEDSISNYISENEADIIKSSDVNDGRVRIGTASLTSAGIGEGALGSVTFEVLEKKASTIVLSDVTVNRPDATLYDIAISTDKVVIQ